MGYYEQYLAELKRQAELQKSATEQELAEKQKILRDMLSARGLSVSGTGLKQLGELQRTAEETIQRGQSALAMETARVKAMEQAEKEAKKQALAHAIATGAGTVLGGVGGAFMGQPLLGAQVGGTLGSIVGRAIAGTPEAIGGIPQEIVSGLQLMEENELKKLWQDILEYQKQNQPGAIETKPIPAEWGWGRA